MKDYVATITVTGHVTIPAEVQKHLGISPRDQLSLVIGDDGIVRVESVVFPDVDSLVGIAGTLAHTLSWDEARLPTKIVKSNHASMNDDPDHQHGYRHPTRHWR